MQILFDATKSVKPRNRLFGLGLGRNRSERLPIGPSDEDRAWAAYHLNVGRSGSCLASEMNPEADIDRRAEEAAVIDRMSNGFAIL